MRFGADFGAVFACRDPARGFTAQVRARGPLTHAMGVKVERGIEALLGSAAACQGLAPVATPHAGWSRSEESETWRLGQRLRLGASEWKVESELGEDRRTYRAGYGYRLGGALDLSLEATRSEAANDDAPGHEIMLRAEKRW